MAEPQKNEEVSPEEKLLNVIQGDSGKREAEGKISNDEGEKGKEDLKLRKTPKDTKMGEEGERGKRKAGSKDEEAISNDEGEKGKKDLKLRKTPKDLSACDAQADAKKGEEGKRGKKLGVIGGTSAAVPKARKEGKAIAFNIPTVNKIMGVAIILVFGLISYEVWGNVGREKVDRRPQTLDSRPQNEDIGDGAGQSEEMAETEGAPELQDLLNSFAEKPMLRVFEQNEQRGQDDETIVETKVVRKGKFEQYASQNLNLVALSTSSEGKIEGVVVDKKEGKTLFLSQGQKASFGEWEVEVAGIQSDRLVLNVDDKQVVVK